MLAVGSRHNLRFLYPSAERRIVKAILQRERDYDLVPFSNAEEEEL